MSERNRYGRDGDQRRYGSEERERSSVGQDDPYGQYGDWRDREGRSFGDRERGYGYGSRDDRPGGFDQQEAAREGSYGQGYSQAWDRGDDRQGGYGEGSSRQALRQQDYGRRDDRGQDYRRQEYRPQDRRQVEVRGGGQQAYGQGGNVFGGDPRLQRISDGKNDERFFAGHGEHRGRGPKNYSRSDERIRDDVNDRLSDDSWLDASEIEIEVASAEVTLNGSVENREDKRRAEDIVEQVSGVKHVQNNLRVQQSGARQADPGANP